VAKTVVTGVAPMFLVDEVVATAEWYRDTLGFHIGDYYSDDHGHDEDGNDIPGSPGEVFFVIIDRDGHRLMLGKTLSKGLGVTSNASAKQESSDAYFWCEGVDELFTNAKAAGAEFVEEPVTRFYGMREFQIKDRDGRVLTFGAPVIQDQTK
jgi:uncharacterized glyoxalase superfamily protein PhnB